VIGERLGRYRLLSELGSGGMGTVYLAEDDEGSRRALKIVHPHLELTPRFKERFLREAAIGKRIRHPNVVATYDVDTLESNGRPALFLAMEYVEGQTLRALLEELGRVPEELCVHIAMEITKALDAIHAAGVVHRDLKPENVLITKEHVVKVMDLGVARVLDETVGLSQTGSFVGSVLYGAPEQFGAASPDGRADLYALGLLLYELSTGLHPFSGNDVATVIQRQLTEAPQPPAQVNPEITLFFSEVTRNLLSKDRDDRIATAGRLRATLEAGEQSDWWQRRATGVRKSNVSAPRRVRIPRETALFGRDEQLASMRALFEQARTGDGQTLLIEGEAGIGKTRLVDEFVGRLRDEGEDVHFLFGRYPPGGAATAASAFVAAVRDHFGVEGIEKALGPYLEVAPTLVPSFAALLRGDATPKGEEALTTDALHAVFVHVTRGLAKERPTILLIDDLHFAPDGGRALFAALSMAMPGHPVLLVGTSGPGLPDEWLEASSHFCRLTLSRLGPKDLAHVLTDAFSSEELAKDLAFQIGAKSDGNPLFVFEIIQGLRDGRYLTRRDDGAWQKAQVIDEIRIPDTVKDLIRGRIANLDEAGRNLLEVAACCGQKFDPRLVGDVLGLDRIPVLRRLGGIEKRHHLVRFAGPVCMFDHHQVQEVLYEGLSEPLREEYHAALADGLELRDHTDDGAGSDAVALCRHFLLAGRGRRTRPYLSTALDYLEKNHSNDAAIDLVRQVLAVDGLFDGRARVELLLRLRARLDLLGRREEEREVLHEALDVADETGDPGLQARACHELGQHFFRVASYEEAGAFFRQALALADEGSDAAMAAETTRCMGSIAFQRGEFEEARKFLRRARAMARMAGDKLGEAKSNGNLGIALLNLGRPVEARRHLHKHLVLSREVGDRQGEVTATINLGLVSSGQGDMEEARRNFERGLALSREMGFRQGEASATGNLGSVYHSLGRFAEARERFDSHNALCRETGDRRGETIATGNLGMVSLSLGCYSDAYDKLASFCIRSREIGDMRGEALALEAMGRLQIGLGDPTAARESLTAALALARAIGARGPEGDALHTFGLLAENEGDVEEARRRYGQALEVRRATARRGCEAATLVALGRLLDDEEHLEAALRLARSVGAAGTALVAGAHLARLRGSVEILANEAQAEHAERMEARYALWQATGQRSHLDAARRLLRDLLERAPAHSVDAMRHNVRLHRAVLSRA